MADIQFTTGENWRPVVGYEGLYNVSNDGRVQRQGKNKCLKLRLNTGGYPYVTLSQQGKVTTITVHKLVASAFLGPRPANLVVNHKNGIKTDNRLSNLEYVTQKENIGHACELGLSSKGGNFRLSKLDPKFIPRGERRLNSKLTEEQVREIRNAFANSRTTFTALGNHFGVSRVTIRRIVKRELWAHVT